ncbi:MAG: undecaprenyldiphospho-muramoylpentapeptide beta-N-acetylglucosaminyltransferase [Treponema sp.]|jgi:UDP-N-acetylglucosamine--N-acetylmuramyl-(pentapeptide) pyrophosphoryl-undecaprenol N-acetylglucosamine transferase|nr:undecaprenyldiphospho-muramoylpentapeptide beta-N-acetylglucosaminyltransferase [Treponema sp.]
MVNIAFTGGGTGGHIYPGLAVAACLKGMGDFRVFWIGSSSGMDRSIVEKAGMEFHGVPSGRLRRYFSLKTVPDMFRVAAGFFAARSLLKKQRPALLFSKGGFVSVPPCAAAASLGIPVFTHESDFSPGLATRLNLRFVARNGGRIFTAYAETASSFPPAYQGLVRVSGNPVRPEFRNARAEKGRAFLGLGAGERVLLVLGGSQGARELNNLVREALAELTKLFVVVHQTGAGYEPASRERYLPYPYFGEELPHVLAAASLVLCRAGAGTVYENAVLGRAMILAPLRGSGTRGDQVENARFFEKSGAALVLPEDPKAETLLEAVSALAADPEKLGAMAAAAARIGKTDGAAFIARAIAEAAGGAPDRAGQGGGRL